MSMSSATIGSRNGGILIDQPKNDPMGESNKFILSEEQNESLKRLFRHLDADSAGMTALKGHLIIEEFLTRAIQKFVWHPEHLDDARLSFAQKLSVCRSMSLDNNDKTVWDLISKLNGLRNAFSHSLQGERRTKATDALRSAYMRELGEDKLDEFESTDVGLLLGVIALCMGFLSGFENEVERFREKVNALDKLMNPHRYAKTDDSQAEKNKPIP
jgi:hypothetical protein